MKFTTLFAAAATGLFLCSVSCERHSWDEVKKLHEQHGHGGHHEGAAGEHHEGGAGEEHAGGGVEKHEGGEHAAPEHKTEEKH